MMFWDSSAIIPLCIDEPQTKTTRQIVRKDSAVAVWWGSFIECCSAFASCGARDSSNLKRKTECGISSPFSRIHGRRLNRRRHTGYCRKTSYAAPSPCRRCLATICRTRMGRKTAKRSLFRLP